ncbi:MAG: thiamine diphosphokinase [Clostridiales bacterium]|jgi:thiamine pyrophosphokinase|nr:thiamine diphosphokinase [Clostridiales bacterium]
MTCSSGAARNAIIFAGADFNGKVNIGTELIICCDSGLRHARALGLTPDYIVGDMDSVDPDTLNFYESRGVPVMRYSAKKDMTDLEIAVKLALDKNVSGITVFGALNGRLDHVLGSIHALVPALSAKTPAVLEGENERVTLTDGISAVSARKGTIISMFPLTSAVLGVTTRGFEYPLNDGALTIGSARGLSNVLTEDKAEISVKEGILVIIENKMV